MLASVVVLALALGAYAYFFKGDFGRLSELTAFQPPGWRRRYGVWIAKSWLLFAAPALIGLALLGKLDAVVVMPAAFLPLAQQAGYPAPILGEGIAIGLIAGSLIGAGWTLVRRRKGKPPAMLGDFSTLLPRDRSEGWLAAASAISAGITEELYFRLLLPLAIAGVTGSAAAGFVVAAILFALAHRYQRWLGVIATGLVGVLFAYLYLQSGVLWVAMAVHAAVDLNGMVVRPALAGMLRRTD
ncbi:CPBP family intramembrane glutamic endopeptidase [Hephaestia mangrovi]|uniref:CPBP family intramembrane glutamic endopeptidase n=1 Tax=Hephaestia mangrovi TaxID=2873268 RepID=UPI001CA611FC|nr:CPBP family intramembrane glutamic endopeptidase [Hephaestia mangrovi]MBY8826906.1 CPBP family intramembrane metalloprotease [Hephaestia mangrovi]